MADAPDFAARRAALSPLAVAFVDHATGRDWTFAEVEAEAAGLAAALQARGLAPGDRVGVLALNRAEVFVALFAARKAGLVLVPLNWRAPVAELAGLVAQVGCRALIHDSAHTPQATALGLPCMAMDDSGGFGLPHDEPVPATLDEDAPWYLLFTSGTSGRPKAVIQTARMAQAVAVNLAQALGLTDAARGACALPLFHTAGINLFALPLFLWGGHSHILPRPDPDALLALVADGRVSHLFAVPTVWQALAGHPQARALARLQGAASGGAPLAPGLSAQLAALGVILRNGFGMTETGPTGFLADAATARSHPASIGTPQLLTEARLDGVPDGAPGTGELLMRGATVTPGYFGDPDATAAAFRDGWLRTGDVAQRDAAGRYVIVDRIKDIFISGGENVAPAEVEAVLCAHPAVAEAAVIGIPDPRWGEVGAAFVVLHPGQSAEPQALADWCRLHLAGFKVPQRFRLVDALPRTASGKLRKADLRALA
jgi:fatty-acyl-CoA synthase